MSVGTNVTHAEPKKVPQKTRTWGHYIKVRNIVFGLVIFGLGLGSYFIPLPFGLKDLLSGAIVGTGVATILTEFTFAFERRESDEGQQNLTEQNQNLMQRINILKSHATKPQLYQSSQLFQLGTNVAGIQWQKADLKDDVRNLAEVLSIHDVIEQFLNLPDMQTPESASALNPIKEAIELRYPREGVDAFVAGYAMNTWVSMGYPLDDSFEIVRKGILALDLQPDVKNYIDDSFQTCKAEKALRKNLIFFSALFQIYISNITTDNNPDIVAFFEKEHLAVAKETTVQRMLELLQKIADSP